MDFIFMLTRDDQTIEDCVEVLDQIATVPLQHIGFKDVGVDVATLHALHDKIRERGAQSYLEVVSTTREAALDSVRLGRELGVDWVMGGTWTAETLAVLQGTQTRFLPFPGRPTGHPTTLGGNPDEIAADCRAAEADGAAGVDLLAYRASDAAPLDLVRAARAATTGRLVVAGSIATVEQIRDLAVAGADAFTVGQAAFTGALNPRKGSLSAQLHGALAAASMESASKVPLFAL